MTDYPTKANVYSITPLDNERHSYHTNEKIIMWREVFSKHEKYIERESNTEMTIIMILGYLLASQKKSLIFKIYRDLLSMFIFH